MVVGLSVEVDQGCIPSIIRMLVGWGAVRSAVEAVPGSQVVVVPGQGLVASDHAVPPGNLPPYTCGHEHHVSLLGSYLPCLFGHTLGHASFHRHATLFVVVYHAIHDQLCARCPLVTHDCLGGDYRPCLDCQLVALHLQSLQRSLHVCLTHLIAELGLHSPLLLPRFSHCQSIHCGRYDTSWHLMHGKI